MANTNLRDDVERWEDIRIANAAGVFQPISVDAMASFAVSVDNAALGFAEIGMNPKTNNPARGVRRATGAADGAVFTATVSGTIPDPMNPGSTITLTPWVETFTVVADAEPVEIVGDPNSVDDVALPPGV